MLVEIKIYRFENYKSNKNICELKKHEAGTKQPKMRDNLKSKILEK